MRTFGYHPSILPLSLVQIVNALGLSLLIPVLPTISEQFGGGTVMYGLLLSIYALFQFFSAPLWGSLSDRYGRKRIMLISQRGTLMSRVIFGLAWFVPMEYGFLGISAPLWIIMGARIFDGITAGNNAVINAYIADISPTRQEKVKYFGMMAAMIGIGIMIGPLLGGLSASFSSRGNFGTIISAAFLSLVTFIILRVTLPASPYQPDPDEHTLSLKDFGSKINVPRDIIHTTDADKRLGPLWIMMTTFSLLFLGYTTVYVLHATETLGLTIIQVGLVGTMVGLIFAINQLLIVPRVSTIYGPYHMLLWGHIMMALGLGAMTYVGGVLPFLLYSILLASGIARCMTLFNTIITTYGSGHNEGYLLGLKESVMAAASILAPLIGAGLYALFSQDIFILYAVVAAVMVLLVYTQLDIDKHI